MINIFNNNNFELREDEYWQGDLIMCKKCNTARLFISEDKKFRNRCACYCQSKLYEQKELLEKEEKNRKERQIKLNKAIPYVEWQKDTFEIADNKEDTIYQAVKIYAEKFVEMYKNCRGLLFYGNLGSGKTFYQCCIANYVFDLGYSVMMRNSAELVTIFDSGKNTEISELLYQINSVDLFILDDLGTERATDFATSKLYQIINTRMNSNKPLIVSTNLSAEQIKNEKNANLQRIYDRLKQKCMPIEVIGNRRKIKAKENFVEMKKILGL